MFMRPTLLRVQREVFIPCRITADLSIHDRQSVASDYDIKRSRISHISIKSFPSNCLSLSVLGQLRQQLTPSACFVRDRCSMGASAEAQGVEIVRSCFPSIRGKQCIFAFHVFINSLYIYYKLYISLLVSVRSVFRPQVIIHIKDSVEHTHSAPLRHDALITDRQLFIIFQQFVSADFDSIPFSTIQCVNVLYTQGCSQSFSLVGVLPLLSPHLLSPPFPSFSLPLLPTPPFPSSLLPSLLSFPSSFLSPPLPSPPLLSLPLPSSPPLTSLLLSLPFLISLPSPPHNPAKGSRGAPHRGPGQIRGRIKRILGDILRP